MELLLHQHQQLHQHLHHAPEIQAQNQPMVMLEPVLPERLLVKHAQWHAILAILFLLAL
jgi:hypothetical protein